MLRSVVNLLFFLLLLIGNGIAWPQARPDLGHAEALLKQGRVEEAWKLLEPHEDALAGREEFDYLLGVAALESGRADRATLILERVLAVNPNHAAARLDMGRAYFALGDYERARIELESVQKFDPPAAARATIQRYLAAIDEKTRARGLRVTGYVETAVGYDSNVNAASAQGTLFVPLFGVNFDVSSSSRRDDGFLAVGGGMEISYPLSEGLSLVAGADLRQRAHPSQDAFDHRSGDLRAGVQLSSGSDTLRLMLGGGRYDLDNAYYRKTQSAGLEWRRQLDTQSQLTAFVQESRLRYVQEATRSQSSNFLVYGLGGVRQVDQANRSYLFASAFRGTDTATDARTDGDRRLWGGRAGVQAALWPDADWFASLSYQKSTYEQQNVIFSSLRRDKQKDLAFGINWQMGGDWTLRPQLNVTRNESTIPVNDYDRYELSVTARHDWR